ncbi:MAG: class I SAM-dependent methyltransferase [Proteobacteria bacterium]|nr:class I SAM-dependent methyltransferase [Pseudomonadota bacterium]MBU1581596.1 class I SAM-dependent methyltransferase [Pseudomonadota bacterium]MBU2452246.1 class I SAM-dependent methyltransferase [Pseudomonadota bacterium]MBU2631627.1 class I SAM-dependent methyltransferase [Pseudomonadota bacterium]
MDGWWDCDALDRLFEKLLKGRMDLRVKATDGSVMWRRLTARMINLQNRARAFIIGQRHYDIGNSLFLVMLDKGMNYSCAFWHKAQTLDKAQEAKLDRGVPLAGLES